MIKNLVNGRLYIGSSINMPLRWRSHRNELNRGVHINPHLQAAWNKYGETSFCFHFVEAVEPDLLIAREQNYLDFYWNTGLYNILRVAGSPLGMSHTDETKKKISEALKIKACGRKHSKETKAKIGAKSKGRRLSVEARAKISENNRTRWLLTDEILGDIIPAND